MWWNWVGKAVEEAGKHVGGAEDGLRAGIQRRNARMGRSAGARGGVGPYEGKAGMKPDDGSRPTPVFMPSRTAGTTPSVVDTRRTNQARNTNGTMSKGPFNSRHEYE